MIIVVRHALAHAETINARERTGVHREGEGLRGARLHVKLLTQLLDENKEKRARGRKKYKIGFIRNHRQKKKEKRKIIVSSFWMSLVDF